MIVNSLWRSGISVFLHGIVDVLGADVRLCCEEQFDVLLVSLAVGELVCHLDLGVRLNLNNNNTSLFEMLGKRKFAQSFKHV
jgi:hypothetical protein